LPAENCFLLGQSVHVQGVECELHLNKLGWRMLRVTLLGKLHSDYGLMLLLV